MNRDEVEAVFDGRLACLIKGIERHERDFVGAVKKQEDRQIVSSALFEVGHLAHTEMPQLLGGHFAQCRPSIQARRDFLSGFTG